MKASPDSTAEVYDDIASSGYYPEAVAAGLRDALAGESVQAYVIHHEPTFDHDEVRRHMTVVALTATRLILVHTDEHPPDEILPQPYTSTTSEAIAISKINSVVVTRMVSSTTGRLAEAVLAIGWGAVSRIDIEPARCPDPDCEADHGYTGSIARDDFTMRLAAAGDGGAAVEQLVTFARSLSSVTTQQKPQTQ